MKARLSGLPGRYQAALCTYLKKGEEASFALAKRLGDEALAAGLRTLDLAIVHEQTLVSKVLRGCPAGKRAALIKQAGVFFAAAIIPHEATRRIAPDAAVHLNNSFEALSARTVELAVANRELSLEITQRRVAEKALKKSERHYSKLLKQSGIQQEEMRLMSRQVLSAHEDERKKISRELHDVVAQVLTTINLRLATLKQDASVNTKGLDREIARTQRLVEKSVNIVHRFARELRPAVLDDHGLIPALHSFMKNFTKQTGIRTHLTAFAEAGQLNTAHRTVFFRVAQEALNNVARHAQASQAEITIQKLSDGICMKVKDNGKSFQVDRVSRSRGSKRLGLLGMKERLEMVGGRFNIKSAPRKGTTVEARIPLARAAARRK